MHFAKEGAACVVTGIESHPVLACPAVLAMNNFPPSAVLAMDNFPPPGFPLTPGLPPLSLPLTPVVPLPHPHHLPLEQFLTALLCVNLLCSVMHKPQVLKPRGSTLNWSFLCACAADPSYSVCCFCALCTDVFMFPAHVWLIMSWKLFSLSFSSSPYFFSSFFFTCFSHYSYCYRHLLLPCHNY